MNRCLYVSKIDREAGIVTLTNEAPLEGGVLTAPDAECTGFRLGQAWKSQDGIRFERDYEREATGGYVWALVHRCIGGKRGPDEILGVFRTPAAAAESELAENIIGRAHGFGEWLPTHVSVSPARPDPDVEEFSYTIDGEMERLTITRFWVQP